MEVLEQFSSTYPGCAAVPIGEGNINDTFLVTSSSGKFILQRISAVVFKEPLHVITNFRKISEYLGRRTGQIAPEWQFARPVCTDNGDLFYKDGTGDFWRAQTYLPHKEDAPAGGFAQFRNIGQALGLFHLLMSDMDEKNLHDPLPSFHILPSYLEQFDLACINKECFGRYVDYCFEIIQQYRGRAGSLERAKKEGVLAVQPVHGDPKIDNFIFNEAGSCVGLIDMDTVGSGLIQTDLGDCLRSCCNRNGEGASGGNEIQFDMGICRDILDGYFQRAAVLFSPLQRRYIFDGLLLVTFELGLRFFTDYLLGNRYFKIKAADDNLTRAITQFRLVEEIEKYELEIRAAAEPKA